MPFIFKCASSEHDDVTWPAPGVLSITGEWAELVVGESIVKVTVVGVVEHGFDALSEKWSHLQSSSDTSVKLSVTNVTLFYLKTTSK